MRKAEAVVFLIFAILATQKVLCSKSDILRQRKLPPCRACKTFIESFEKVSKNRFSYKKYAVISNFRE